MEASRIHLFDVRAALLGVRRACAQRVRGEIVVSHGENMSEVLSTERGRATNRALNVLHRRSLAWQFNGDVDWWRCHGPVAKNVADVASR